MGNAQSGGGPILKAGKVKGLMKIRGKRQKKDEFTSVVPTLVEEDVQVKDFGASPSSIESSSEYFTDPATLTPAGTGEISTEINECYFSEESVHHDVQTASYRSNLSISQISRISIGSLDPLETFASPNVLEFFGRDGDVEKEEAEVCNVLLAEDELSHSREYKRFSSVPGESHKEEEEKGRLRKISSLFFGEKSGTECQQFNVQRPKFVPEKLDFKLYEKFEGYMLVNWLTSEFVQDREELKQDLRHFAAQFCTHLLAAGVLHQIPDKEVPMYNIFKPDLMYFWAHSEAPMSVPQTPGRLNSISWPPSSPSELLLTPSSTGLEDEVISKATSAKDVEIYSLEEEIIALRQQLDKYKTLAEIQELTAKAVGDFDDSPPVEEERKFWGERSIEAECQTDWEGSCDVATQVETYIPDRAIPPPPPLPQPQTVSTSSSTSCAIPPPPPLPEAFYVPPPPPLPQEFRIPPPPPPPPMLGDCPAFNLRGGPPPPPPPLPNLAEPPPPPPQPNSMGPAPLPPPPPGGWTTQKSALRKLPVALAVPMKPLYWTRLVLPEPDHLESASITTSVWSKVDELHLENIDEFRELFSRQIIARKSTMKNDKTTAKSHKVEPVKLLDSKRSQNVGILAQSLHVDFGEIENAIYNLDTSVVSLEALQQIYEARATTQELQLIEDHLASKPEVPLDKPEHFLHDLAQISNFAERISCFMFQIEFDDAISNIGSVLNNMKSTCDFLMDNDCVAKVLSIILTLGNYMNGGNMARGQADGYGLEILAKLRDVKSKDSQVTLLHFVVRTYINENESETMALPISEPEDIRRAASVNFEETTNSLARLRKDLEVCTSRTRKVKSSSTPDNLHPFEEKMDEFLANAETHLDAECENLEECRVKFSSLMKSYRFKPKSGNVEDCVPGDFFELWCQFASDFKEIWKKEIARIEKERLEEFKRRQTERRSIVQKTATPQGLRAKVQRYLDKN